MVVLYNCHSYLIILCQGAPDNIVLGSHVWVEDPSLAWIDGEVFRINDQEVHVRATNGKTVCATYQLVLFPSTFLSPHLGPSKYKIKHTL